MARMRMCAIALVFAGFAASAAQAETVHLEVDCAAAGYTLGTDCFEGLSALSNWLWLGATPRDPGPGDPVIVDVGIGEIGGGFLWCNSANPADPDGWVTFRGESRERSKLVGSTFVVFMEDCDGLEFQHLTIESGFVGALWHGVGSSHWTDVRLQGDYNAWYDTWCGNDATLPHTGEHYFYGSKIEAGSLGYYAQCGQTWLYGSEVLVDFDDDAQLSQAQVVAPIAVAHRGDVRLFGSAVRLNMTTTRTVPEIHGVLIGDPLDSTQGTQAGFGEFHMHGGIVSISAPGHAGTTYGVEADAHLQTSNPQRAFAHTLGTSFIVNAGGPVERAAGSGRLLTPFLWQSGTDEPIAGMKSLTGRDMYVETDCSTSSCTGGGDSHLMIYQESCDTTGTGGPWFDTVTGACRNP